MSDIGKLLVIVGFLLAGAGALLWLGSDKGWFRPLPGDIVYRKGSFTFYFPIVTSLLLSIVLTLIFRWFRRG